MCSMGAELSGMYLLVGIGCVRSEVVGVGSIVWCSMGIMKKIMLCFFFLQKSKSYTGFSEIWSVLFPTQKDLCFFWFGVHFLHKGKIISQRAIVLYDGLIIFILTLQS
jgi:hypothetical protein